MEDDMAQAERKPPSEDALAALVRDPVTPFEGRDVIKTSFVVPGLAGGLRKATKYASREFRTGDIVRVVMEFEVGAIKFDPVKDTDAYDRVHTWAVQDLGILEGDEGADLLSKSRAARQRLREKALGTLNLLDDAPRTGDEMDDEREDGDPGDDEV